MGSPQTSPTGPELGQLLAGRYRRTRHLGSGGFGEVFAALDSTTDREVAIKRLPAGALEDRARESAALRLMRFPGVVQLIDEFDEGGRSHLVMELVEGEPFPGRPAEGLERGRAPWSWVEPVARRLLSALSRVHAEGLLHLDLKPQNVLVTDNGRPHLLDFGVSMGRAFAPWDQEGRRVRGTALYAAPEQLMPPAEGGPGLDPRADLFAVGAMLYEACTGQPPFGAQADTEEYWSLRLGQRPPIPEDCAWPARAREWLGLLLQPLAADRPSSAREALDLLGAAPRGTGLARLAPASRSQELEALFAGPDALLHLRSDPAELLFERTGGSPAEVRRELNEWVDAGLATWQGDRVALGRRDLELLREEHRAQDDALLDPESRRVKHLRLAESAKPENPMRLLHWVLAGRPEAGPRAALDALPALMEAGDYDQASALLLEALSILEQEGPEACRVAPLEFFEHRTWIALASQDERELSRTRAELARWLNTDVALTSLDRLLEAGLGALGSDPVRAQAALLELGPLEHAPLESWRRTYTMLAAQHAPKTLRRAALNSLDREGLEGDALTAVEELRGKLLYRSGQYADSATAFERAASAAARPAKRIAATILAASARMELADFDRAHPLVSGALVEAIARRRPQQEAHALYVLRVLLYRRGGPPQPPEEDLAEAIVHLGHPALEAQISFHEGVLAGRANRDSLASELLGRAERLWRQRGQETAADLAELARGVAVGDLAQERIEAIARRAEGVHDATLVTQLGGLLACLGVAPKESWRVALDELRARHEDSLRWDVLSLGEIAAAYDGRPHGRTKSF